MDQELRQSARADVRCDIDFKRAGDARYRVELFNLSVHGCCLSPPVRLRHGERLSLRLPKLAAIPARVVWAEGWRAGVRFDQSFHVAVFDHVARRLAERVPAAC